MISILDTSGLQIDLSERSKWVGVIGSREPTQEEYSRSYNIGKTLAQRGFVVVSGLAKGMDTAAHLGALDGSGQTIAIVNTPIEQAIYPRENQQLAERIRKQGCIIHPFKEKAREDKGEYPNHFIKRLLERDRLLAYICPRIIAVSDKEIIKGGTRYAVHFGMEWGKEVFRCNSEGKYHKNPKHSSCSMNWHIELKVKEIAKWMDESKK